jgi:hypothetical protein
MILMIVVILVAVVIVVATYGAAAPLLFVSIGLALSFVLINALLPPHFPKMGGLAALNVRSNGAKSDSFALTGSRNRPNPYGPIPVIYGVHAIYPAFR